MKKLKVLVCLVALGVIVGFSQLTPLRAHNASTAAVSPLSTTQPSDDKQEAKTFLGKITEAKAQDGSPVYVLEENAGNRWMLDDQAKAKEFDGQNVKVTGTVDVASRTIHVIEIQQSA